MAVGARKRGEKKKGKAKGWGVLRKEEGGLRSTTNRLPLKKRGSPGQSERNV